MIAQRQFNSKDKSTDFKYADSQSREPVRVVGQVSWFNSQSRYRRLEVLEQSDQSNRMRTQSYNKPKDIAYFGNIFFDNVKDNYGEDILNHLATKYFNNPTLWWILLEFNGISDPFAFNFNEFPLRIKIPNFSYMTSSKEYLG